MNILLIFPGFVIAFIIGVFFTLIIFLTGEIIEDKKPKNKVHFYVARDKNSRLYLYLSKPEKHDSCFWPAIKGRALVSEQDFNRFNLKVGDFKNLKWEDEPIEVFLDLKD